MSKLITDQLMKAAIISNYFPDLSDKQKLQFNQLGDLYIDWNKKINVISRKDMGAFYERHVLHSLAIAKYIAFAPDTSILDVGTGGGFPGIPLAIFFPSIQFHLVDSVGKKINVVNAVVKELCLKNVTSAHVRMEQMKGGYDFIVSRAVTKTKQLIDWTTHLIAKDNRNDLGNGWLLLKGGDLAEELKEVNQKYTVSKLSELYRTEFFETKKLVCLVK